MDDAAAERSTGVMARLDAWMARNPWHPRVVPFAVYIVFLPVVGVTHWAAPPGSYWLHPVLYGLQCGLVCWLLWRYRRLLPELNLRHHWLAWPVGVGVLLAWIGLGYAMAWLFPGWLGVTRTATGEPEPHVFQKMHEVSPALMWVTLVLRLVGMSVVVPLFEELFIRSLCLRSFHRWRPTLTGLTQALADMPVVGEAVERTKWGQRGVHTEVSFAEEFERTPVGAVSAFGFAASTFVFMVHHVIRDWPGTILCAAGYCWLLWWTNRGNLGGGGRGGSPRFEAVGFEGNGGGLRLGLGPIVWAHGITNALLWAFTLWSGDWRFL